MMWARKNLLAVLLASFVSVGNAAEFFILPNSKTLLMMGETIPSDVATLSKYIEKGEVDSLMLKGPGGSLEAGYAIADLVLEHELNVTIPAKTDCASACSLIFVAGKNRKMEELSRLGFHLPFINIDSQQKFFASKYCEYATGIDFQLFAMGIGTENALGSCLMLTYQKGLKDIKRLQRLVIRDGISEKVLDLVIETPSNEMTWVQTNDARKLGLVND